jgi:Nucleoside 2-deoxyribosyltransferase like
MRVVQCPAEANPDAHEASLFLAGGISNCPDWQSRLLEALRDTDWVVFNPRRMDFDSSNPDLARVQIEWEHRHLRVASAVAFWFPPQTLCPITLYELGAWSMTKKPLFVGVDPAYARRLDVLEQTRLVRPDVRVVDSLEVLAGQLKGVGG